MIYTVFLIPFYLSFGFLCYWRSRYFSPKMKKLSDSIFFVLIFLLTFLHPARALGHNAAISFNDAPGRLELATCYTSVQLILDAADWPGVLRVADDLAVDFGRVTCANGSVSVTNGAHISPLNASMIFNITRKPNLDVPGAKAKPKGGITIAGTLGKSAIINGLVKQGRIDVGGIKGQWEAFKSQIVRSPMHTVDQALVIAGSDKRGTIYGLYDISEQIGVSPWYYWADVPPKSHDIACAFRTAKAQASTFVKYRGIFLNDEAPALTGFINAKYPAGKYGPGFNANFSSTVFEFLRSRANYLWPAQWNSMFNVDDARSQPLADEYDIVMGTNHIEPMMRATKEWNTFGHGPWQWNLNNASICSLFVEGAQRAKPYEGVMTMRMRGSGDTAMSAGIGTDMLENIVQMQRQILIDVYGNATVPQMWCLYEEVQSYYEAA